MFLAAWAVQHVIDVNPGGVAGPIRVGVFEKGANGEFIARDLPDAEIAEHLFAIDSARGALRDWRKNIGGQSSQSTTPPPPDAPS